MAADTRKLTLLNLGNMRYSVCDDKVEDSFNLKLFRYVPNLKPIIAGVAEHIGGLLPVLDPAVCFQRETLNRESDNLSCYT